MSDVNRSSPLTPQRDLLLDGTLTARSIVIQLRSEFDMFSTLFYWFNVSLHIDEGMKNNKL